MMQLFNKVKIEAVLPQIDVLPAIEAGFVAYSAEKSIVPPVGELLLEKGEVHIKYGAIKQTDYYVIKIASGFYDNPKLGLPSSNGVMLLFSQHTGELLAVLHDEGMLTDIRTAAAGAIAAKYLAPKQVTRIGIVGTGIQARLQLAYLAGVTDCRDVLVWGRGQAQLDQFIEQADQFNVVGTLDSAEILQTCNLVVTTTPASEPILQAADLRPGTHITAVGSDTPHKQELDAAILQRADVVVADSISQCLTRGEIHRAIGAGLFSAENAIELGNVIAGKAAGRSNAQQITVADLTGVAVQDIQIASAVYEMLVR